MLIQQMLRDFPVLLMELMQYQQAVEEHVSTQPQRADDQVEQVVEELHVQDHGFVTARERSPVPHETQQENHLVTNLHIETHTAT